MGSKNSTPAQRPHAMSQHSAVSARNEDGPVTNQAIAEGRGPVATASDPGARIKVRATQDGHYQHIYRREGDVFVLIPIKLTAPSQLAARVKDGLGSIMTAEEQFSERWMEKVRSTAQESITTSNQALREKTDEIVRSNSERLGKGSGELDDDDEEEESVI